MIDLRKYVLVAAMICCISIRSNAQVNIEDHRQDPSIYSQETEKQTVDLCSINITCNGQPVLNGDTIQQGDTLTFKITWNKIYINEIIIKGIGKYRLNKNALNVGTFVIKKIPRKTFRYECKVLLKPYSEIRHILNVDIDNVESFPEELIQEEIIFVQRKSMKHNKE